LISNPAPVQQTTSNPQQATGSDSTGDIDVDKKIKGLKKVIKPEHDVKTTLFGRR